MAKARAVAELAFRSDEPKASGQETGVARRAVSEPLGADLAKFRAVDAARPTTERSCTISFT